MSPTAWSLLPPLVALVLAVWSRRVVPSLAAGGLTGTVLLAVLGEGGIAAPLQGLLDFVRLGVLGQVSDASKAQVLALILLINGFVVLMEKSGAARALAAWITKGVRTPRQAMLATWVGGLGLFFSDFGNVLILGPVFRPIYDRLEIPRAKLAWIIDSTAAPVCVMLPFVTWGVYAMGLIEQGFAGLEPAAVEAVLPGQWVAETGTVDGFGTFLAAAPFQLYPLLALASIPLIIAAGRDLGPMATALPTPPEAEQVDRPTPPAMTAILPLVLLFVVVALVGWWVFTTDGKLTGAGVRLALAAAYLAAIGSCLALLARFGHAGGAGKTLKEGMGQGVPLLILLVLAWTLGDVCSALGTGAYLASVIGESLPPALLPVALFAAGALTSFATGTSWGTFALLMPIAIPLSVSLGAPAAVCIGAVLSGGVFGDHTSPISDTTLLASMGAGTPHPEHVATQLPYASLAGAAAALSFAVAGATGAWWSVSVGLACLVAAAAAIRVRGHAVAI